MRPRLALVAVLSAALLVAGCASRYESFHRETNHDLRPRPVAPAKVKVFASRDHLRSGWTELGTYEGHAPTVKEAMDAAKSTCGRAGADFFILDVEPFESRGVWTVGGICAAKTRARAAEPGSTTLTSRPSPSPRPRGGRAPSRGT